MRLKPNDTAIIIEGPETTESGHEFEAGTIVRIVSVNDTGDFYLAVDDKGQSWCVMESDVGTASDWSQMLANDTPRIDIVGQNGNDGDHYDEIEYPKHYTSGAIECIDCIRAALTEEEFRGFCKGNVIKYVFREHLKGGSQDLGKAAWYVNQLIED